MELYKGNCIGVMDELIEKNIKVDCIITSPPYDDIRDYEGISWNFNIFKDVAYRLYNILSDDGVLVWIINDKTKNYSETGTAFRQALYFMDTGFKLYDTMIYAKNNPVPLNHRRYEQAFEYMFILTKGKPKTFNGLKRDCLHYGKKKSGTHRRNSDELEKMSNSNKTVKKQALLHNIWHFNVNGNGKDKLKHKHPAIFPLELVEMHIKTWTNENDLVLDCFMGSGTTGVACKKLNRRFIGIELVDKYYDIAEERIKEI